MMVHVEQRVVAKAVKLVWVCEGWRIWRTKISTRLLGMALVGHIQSVI